MTITRDAGENVKEKISLLSRGIFEYERPDIVVSEETIQIAAEAGKLHTGYFDVNSINGMEIRAMVFSSNKLIQCQENGLIGTSNRVNYIFDPQNLEPGESVEGHFSIISNGGEIEIPFKAEVCMPYCQTSIGNIKDLYQFTSLAQSNWHEAVKLFRTQNFARVFLVNKKHMHIYEKLIQGRSANQALEEFLCTLKRKRAINITISQEVIEYEKMKEPVSARLVIEKDTWGYQKISVRTVGSFIQVYKKELTTEDFLGSFYELEYVITPEAFHQGNNYGKIIISFFDRDIEIPVNCLKEYRSEDVIQRRSMKNSIHEIFDNYLKLSMRRMPKDQWIRQTREAVDCCRNNSDEMIYALMEAHFSVMADEENNAKEILSGLNGRELRHQSVIYYCYFLYVSALQRKDLNYTKFAIEKIESYYERQYDYWQLLWMILNMSEKMSPARRFALIKSQFYKSCNSPLLYWEGAKVLNSDPALLREFGNFEIQLVRWGVHFDCLKPDVIYQFSELCVRGKSFDELALKTMIEVCEIYEKKEILMGVCSLLIKGHKTDYCYNRWYALGIESSLKLTDIYEHYMYSLDETAVNDLPLGVLIYFNYNNQLSASKKAFLYAYVVKNQEKLPKIYRDYENIIKAFAHEQLRSSYITPNMVTLYQHFIIPDHMNNKVAMQLPKVLFKYQICCDNPWIRGIIVSHREVENDSYYPLTDQMAYVDIYMDEYQLVFVDREDNRYVGSVAYTMSRLMDDSSFAKECYKLNPDQSMILLNRSERAMKYQKVDEVSIDIYKRTLKLSSIRKQYQKNVLKNLIDFYYDNYEGETLEKYLLKLDISLLDNAERGGIIEYYIQRGLYDKAYVAVREYGYDNIQDKKLMRLCSRVIRTTDYSQDQVLTEMAYSAFSSGKYDEVILEYLIKYYMGTTKDLFAIWKAAKDFEVAAFVLEEKLLCQILFSESFVGSGMQIFASYEKARPDGRIVRAFLAFYAYNYLVRDADVLPELFGFIEMELSQLEQTHDVCTLALLKHYAARETARNGHESWITTQIGFFINKGIILPFFKDFGSSDVFNLPEELLNKTYIQYCSNPKNAVSIHYLYSDPHTEPGNYVVEDMNNVFGGIFVKAFTLFENEQIQYYITEKNQYAQSITESRTLVCQSELSGPPANGKDWINLLLNFYNQGLDQQLEDKTKLFEEQRYMSKKLFTMI